ncbi:type VI secretion system ATPase TssH [Parashewanella curva]|uniref:Type VI secretion system ATPase TssH n=1 Tax=Parashewanella curva TaxID=2338552 RepID=A0A3L8Q0Y5_9GAMM|nr:type VI secretion system ATPase TssH [Parashewanella curva]RLV61245.1 type VI secretion system ATPase TssH [Parashewanella curva]
MINVELQSLVKRLTTELKTTLEDAAGECLARTHFSIELEHWFYVLFRAQKMGWLAACEASGTPKDILITKVNEELASFSKGNDSSPSLSAYLIELLKDAWMLATLNHSQMKVDEYHLLLVLKQRIEQGAYNGALSMWINNLSSEWLKAQSLKTSKTSTSTEIEHTASTEQSFDSNTPALDKYSKNITQAARDGNLDPVTGRTVEIRKAIDILCRRRQNSPILVGDPGVGKTAIVEGLAQQIVSGNVPSFLANVELRALDLSSIQAGASIKGEFENRLKDIITEIKQSAVPIIMFIDEAHTLIGAGGAAGQNDAANILKPALARGEFRSIAATTWAEYKQYFESDAALTRRFQLIGVKEPEEDSAVQMLSGIKQSLEDHHQVKVLQEAVKASVSMSIRYLPDRKLPDKAISLLDTACSRIALSQSATPFQLEALAEQIDYLEKEIKTATHETNLWSIEAEHIDKVKEKLSQMRQEHEQISQQWQQEKVLADEILQLQTQLSDALQNPNKSDLQAQQTKLKQKMDELSSLQGERPLVIPQVNKQTIAEVISLWTGIPVGNMMKQEVERLMSLESHISERVIGQSTPVAEISQTIRMARAGLKDSRKPIGVFLMCGPSGVGKTETALALTGELYGGEHNIIAINMTEFKEEHKVSMLLGSPAGYVGYGKGGVLTEAVRKNPYSVLLLDEMEKAHPGVHDIFYQIFDKGSISDSEGRNIDFKNTIIIMTSNAADGAVVQACEHERPDIPELTQTIFPELQRYFKPAFLGRTIIVPYYPLNDEELAAITRLSLKRIEKSITQRYGASFKYDDEVITEIVNRNQSPETGARAIEQIINRTLMPNLANQCIERMIEGLSISEIDIKLDSGQFDIVIE